jgi:hypothetical protein
VAHNEIRSLLKWGLGIIAGVGIGLGLYVGGYVVLMNRDLPAMDKEEWRLTYRSSFWLAPSVTVCDLTTTMWPAVSPLNVVFWPIDDCWRRICGFIGAIPENEPFASGQLDPGRIKAVRVWINPPDLVLAEKYKDFGRCTRIDVAASDAAQELCQALAAPHSVLTNARGASTVDGTIEAVLDSGGSVFLYFFVYENSEVFVCHPPASPAHDPFANKHGQDVLLPWLREYALQEDGSAKGS